MSETRTVQNSTGNTPILVPQMATLVGEPNLQDLQTMGVRHPQSGMMADNQNYNPTTQSSYRRSVTAPRPRNSDSLETPAWLMEQPGYQQTAPDTSTNAQSEPLPESGGYGGRINKLLQETLSPLPKEPRARKDTPIARGFCDYFPDAIVAVAQLSHIGNKQHNPGAALFWDRTKSTDEADALMRHFLERGSVDVDGVRHSTKVAWRALALLQKELEGLRNGNSSL